MKDLSAVIQYQSFPDAAGDSQTLEKLIALRLPSLQDKTFLDVGCNEGFFCGYALYDGARRAAGIDQSDLFIQRARQRFQDAEFFCQHWDTLPNGPFDVILLLSALHYADDQQALIERIMRQLAPDGCLVLELGIHDTPGCHWVPVSRGFDERLFPTMEKLEQMLQPYAWKYVGHSVQQAGDPVTRHVVHVSHRKPVVYMLLDKPAAGKTTIAKALFKPLGLPVVSGDRLATLLAQGLYPEAEQLSRFFAEGFSNYQIQRKLQALVENDERVHEWAKLCIHLAGGGDFAVDGYFPETHHDALRSRFIEHGYMTVQLNLDEPTGFPRNVEQAHTRAHHYFDFLKTSTPNTIKTPRMVLVDRIEWHPAHITIKGWAMDDTGNALKGFYVTYNGQTQRVLPDSIEQFHRQDVAAYFSVMNKKFGFTLVCPLPGAGVIERGDDQGVTVYGIDDEGGVVGQYREA